MSVCRLFRTVLVLGLPIVVPFVAWAADKTTEGLVTRQDLEVVECLLPGQVRQLGRSTFLSPRRPVRTTTADCRIRGGEYVAYDRADYKSALRVWMATAETGDPEAQTNVGEIYERGIGGEPNYEAAVIWYQKAADQGYSRGLFDLGTLYEQGFGVEKDRLKALNLYRQAWGMPVDSLMYASAAREEQDALRQELEKVIGEKDQQLGLLNKQFVQTEQKLEAAQRQERDAAARASESGELAREVSTLKGLIDRLQSERSASSSKLAALPTAATRSAGSQPPLPPLDPAAETRQFKGMDFGRYYALVIGNQDYQLLSDLQTPRADTDRTARVLKTKYGFTVQVVQDADDVGMLRALNDLNQVLKPNDNLLIYYAGHGSRLQAKRTEVGYWLPVNAEPAPSDTFWLPNEQVTAHLARLPARRILMVADSCFAGLLSTDPGVSMFGTEDRVTLDYVKYKLPKRSRLLLASGGDEPVLDQAGQGNSVFAGAFLDVLEANTGILSSPALFARLKGRVSANAARSEFKQVPEFKTIKGAGHEVGDFFFVPLGG